MKVPALTFPDVPESQPPLLATVGILTVPPAPKLQKEAPFSCLLGPSQVPTPPGPYSTPFFISPCCFLNRLHSEQAEAGPRAEGASYRFPGRSPSRRQGGRGSKTSSVDAGPASPTCRNAQAAAGLSLNLPALGARLGWGSPAHWGPGWTPDSGRGLRGKAKKSWSWEKKPVLPQAAL